MIAQKDDEIFLGKLINTPFSVQNVEKVGRSQTNKYIRSEIQLQLYMHQKREENLNHVKLRVQTFVE